MGIATLYSMYIEGGVFMVALEKDEAGLVSHFCWLSCLELSSSHRINDTVAKLSTQYFYKPPYNTQTHTHTPLYYKHLTFTFNISISDYYMLISYRVQITSGSSSRVCPGSVTSTPSALLTRKGTNQVLKKKSLKSKSW